MFLFEFLSFFLTCCNIVIFMSPCYSMAHTQFVKNIVIFCSWRFCFWVWTFLTNSKINTWSCARSPFLQRFSLSSLFFPVPIETVYIFDLVHFWISQKIFFSFFCQTITPYIILWMAFLFFSFHYFLYHMLVVYIF